MNGYSRLTEEFLSCGSRRLLHRFLSSLYFLTFSVNPEGGKKKGNPSVNQAVAMYFANQFCLIFVFSSEPTLNFGERIFGAGIVWQCCAD